MLKLKVKGLGILYFIDGTFNTDEYLEELVFSTMENALDNGEE